MITCRSVLLPLFFALIAASASCADSTAPEFIGEDGLPIASAEQAGDGSLRIVRELGDFVAIGSNFELITNYSTERNRRGIATVRWTSSDPSVLYVGNSTGVVRALEPGKATITAQNGVAGIDTMTLVVLDTTAIVITPGSTVLSPGDTVEFEVDTEAPVEWSSSDNSVISVTNSGLAIGISAGNAMIIAITPVGARGAAGINVTSDNVGTPPPPDSAGGTKTPPSDTSYVPPPAPPGDTTSLPPPPPIPSTVELPRVFLHDMVAEARAVSTIRSISVSTPMQLQAALDTSQYGDEIVVNPGTYLGSFTLRSKAGSGWITVRGKTSPSLPSAGQRIRPSHGGSLPKLQTGGSNLPVLRTDAGASGYRLVHLEISAAPTVVTLTSLVNLGSGASDQSSAVQLPSRIVMDRVYIHGNSGLGLRRCISMHTATTAIIDSWLSECHDKGSDSQAIASWNGPGPYLIANNHLEGAGENLFFGGADPVIPNQLPEDIEISGNHFYKPPAWQGVWLVKNSLELKIGRRVLVEGNVFENNWADGQAGFAILFKSVNQSGGAPWSETSDVTFRYNIVRNSSHGVTLAGKPEVHPAKPMTRVYIGHNSFEAIGTGPYSGGRLWYLSGVDNVTFEHNTGVGTDSGLLMDGAKSLNLRVCNNVFGTVEPRYGAWDWAIVGSQGRGTAGLNSSAQGWAVEGNVLTAKPSSAFPAGNSWPAAGPSGLGVVSFPSNLRFLPSSPFINKGIDGVMPGVDFDVLAARTAGVVVPP